MHMTTRTECEAMSLGSFSRSTLCPNPQGHLSMSSSCSDAVSFVALLHTSSLESVEVPGGAVVVVHSVGSVAMCEQKVQTAAVGAMVSQSSSPVTISCASGLYLTGQPRAERPMV